MECGNGFKWNSYLLVHFYRNIEEIVNVLYENEITFLMNENTALG